MANGQWTVSDSPQAPTSPTTKGSGGWTVSDSAAPPSDSMGMPTLHELASDNSNNEGLYHMKDAEGHSHAVPFSSVELAGDNWRNMFVSEKEAEQYEKDKKYASKMHPLSTLTAWGQKKFPHFSAEELKNNPELQKYDTVKEHPGVARALLNTGTNAVKTITGAPKAVADWVTKSPWTPAQAAKQREEAAKGGTPIDAEHPLPPVTAEMVSDYASDTAGSIIGGTVLAEGAGAVISGGARAIKAAPEAIARTLSGVSEGLTKREIAEQAAANKDVQRKIKEEYDPEYKKKVDKVREQNDIDKAAHDKKLEDVRKENKEKLAAHEETVKQREKAVKKKIEFSRKMGELKSRIFPKNAASRVKIIQDGAKQYFQKGYDTLSRLTKKQRGDLDVLESLLTDAESKIQGSDTNVAIFNDIRKRINGEKSSQTPPPREDWEAMSPDEQMEWRKSKANSGISYEDLRGYYRELGKLIGSDATPGDIKTASGVMRDGLEKMQSEIAEKSGLRAKNLHDRLSKEYKDYAQTMLDKGSPVTKMLNAKDADAALKVFEDMTPFQKSYTLDLLKGTGEHSDWLRRTERVEAAEGSEESEEGEKESAKINGGEKILTPMEQRASNAVKTAQEKLNSAKEYLKNPPNIKTLQPGWEEGAKKAIVRAEEELEKAKAGAERKAKTPSSDPKARLRNMRNYRQETAGLVRDYLNTQDEHDAIGNVKPPPKPPKLTPEPEFKPTPEPEYDPPKEDTYSEWRLKNRREKQINNRIAFFSSPNFRLGARGFTTFGIADVLAKVLGFHEGVAMTTSGISALSYLAPKQIIKLLTDPAMQEKLLTITAKDREILGKLPANQRVVVEQNIINMERVAKQEGIIAKDSPVPMANFAKKDIVKAKEEAAKVKEQPKPKTTPEGPPPAQAQPKSGLQPTSPPTLPGMEGAVAEQGAAAEAHKAETGKQEVEASLVAPKDDISKATGEMERNSPLFRDSEASGQGGLFSQPQAEPRKNDVQASRRLEDLKVDPKRFQYKLGGNKAGVTDALSDASWNQGLADPIHIWEDPETGEEFVVNGHHRYDLAQKAGADRINVAPIDNKEFPTAEDARRFGAEKNIADGNGTSVDAAKFFRDTGFGAEHFKKVGLSLKKAVANEGLSLARLSDDLFARVVDGRIDSKIGAAIGEATESATDQEAILKDVQRREKQGRPVSAEQIRESARLIKQSPTFTQTTEDLFGNHEEERNLFLEMGEVSEYIQKELADEKRVFGRIATKGASEQLAKGENVINTAKNKEISTRAAQLRELYVKRSAQTGPVHAALQEAAEKLAEGGKPNEIKQNALEEIREHLDEELGN